MHVLKTLIFLDLALFVSANIDTEPTEYVNGERLQHLVDESVFIDTLDYPYLGKSPERLISRKTEKAWHRQHHKYGKRKPESKAQHRKRLLKKLIESVKKNGIHLYEPELNSQKDEKLFLREQETNQTELVSTAGHAYNWELFAFDHRMWIGALLGSLVTMITSLSAALAYNYMKHHRKKQYCVDLNNLSLCSLGEIKRKDPVYVRLSELHDPRAASLRGQYVVSVMNQSNNFSICTDESSSEEELFDISDAWTKSPKKSISKISMTSTPIKGTPARLAGAGNSIHQNGNLPVVASPFASPVIKTEAVENVD